MAEPYPYRISRERRWKDRFVTVAINGAGAMVIVLIALMLMYLIYVAYPLAEGTAVGEAEQAGADKNTTTIVSAADGELWSLPSPLPAAEAYAIRTSGDQALMLSDSKLYLYDLDPSVVEPGAVRPSGQQQRVLDLPGIRAESLVFDSAEDGSSLIAFYNVAGDLEVLRLRRTTDGSVREQRYSWQQAPLQHGTLLANQSDDLLLVIEGDRYLRWAFSSQGRGEAQSRSGGVLAGLGASVYRAAWGPAKETLLVVDANGLHRFDSARPKLPRLSPPMALPLVAVSVSSERRRRVTLLGDEDGRVIIMTPTSGDVLLDEALVDFEKGRPLVLSHDGAFVYQMGPPMLRRWSVENPFPETGWENLWLPQSYGAYEAPAQVWHPDGATIGVLSKFSLSPLIYGTFKAAIYGMLLAVPVALGAAIYTGYFMGPRLRNRIKPLIETLEAFPTVVLGFIAGIWLAPLLADYLVFILLLPLLLLVLPLLLAGTHLVLQYLSPRFVRRPPRMGLVILAYLMGLYFLLGHVDSLETLFFDGSVREWLLSSFGLHYDQRNALLVGLAMGIAIMPTMFSITEDAVHAVPRALSDGSLALGATRWQSLARVVLPAASPAILSALLIGFARGLGETMIVLLATGNTPLMEANLFSGLESLSAAIALELPESPVGGVHFRLLFLGALVLFAMTFVLNTLAELFRQRLRYTYGEL